MREDLKEYKYMDDELYKAARQKDNGDIRVVDEDERLYRITIGDENNILHIAALYGNKELISKIKDQASSTLSELLCKRNSRGETPLHLAAKSGKLETVNALLDAHQVKSAVACCCWREKDNEGNTPLHIALSYAYQDIALLLLKADLNYLVSLSNNAGETPTYLAAQSFCFEFMRFILDVVCLHDNCVSFSGPFGQTAFHPAVTNLNGDIMLLMIERKKNLLRVQDKKGKSVLHYAVEEKRESMVEILLKADSTLAWLHDNDGLTPLHKASIMGLFQMIEIILELSPQSLAIREKRHGKTALHVAKMELGFLKGCLKTTRMKELINEVDNDGNTLLHLVLLNSDPKVPKFRIVNTILEVSGINWRVKNTEGHSPMDLCKSDNQIPIRLKCLTQEWRRKEIMEHMKIFYHKGVKNVDDLLNYHDWEECLNYQGPNGDGIFHIAAREGCINVISKAVEIGGIHNHMLLLLGKNFKGETPLHLAAEHGQLQVVNAIISLYNSINCNSIRRYDNSDHHQVEIGDLAIHVDDLKQQPWRVQSKCGDTPVHKALRNRYPNIALRLLHLDPHLASFVNKENESLLYLAAANNHIDILQEITMNSTNPLNLTGPDGENPLHAVVLYGGKNTVFWLIKKWPELLKNQDFSGKTPLHHAAETGRFDLIQEMLKEDKEAAFMYDNEGLTPLLRAAVRGHRLCIIEILKICPRSIDLADLSNNKTMIHLARMQTVDLNSLRSNYPIWRRLVNQSDKNGNTPLHSAILDHDKQKAFVLLNTNGIDWRITNNQHQTPLDLCEQQMQNNNNKEESISASNYLLSMLEHRGVKGPPLIQQLGTFYLSLLNAIIDIASIRSMSDEKMNQVFQSTSVVGALLVTISYAALFTIPGGYDDEWGQVKRMGELGIQMLVVSDVFAMIMGIGVLLNYVHAFAFGPLLNRGACVTRSIILLELSLAGISLAFLCGVYCTVSSSAIWIFIISLFFAFFTALCSLT